MHEAIVLDKMYGLGALARARTTEYVDNSHFLRVEGGCRAGGGCWDGGLDSGICTGRWINGRHFV